jgi:16S rRNA (guanine527-N7)-methyltransferase
LRELISRDWPELDPAQLDRLQRHFDLMLSWNRKLNLTRVTKVEEAARFHYGESLFLAQVLPPGPLRIADIGSGAGFPGFPLAVTRPECSVTLIESDQRKAVFLREASRDFPNVTVLARRAEDCSPDYEWIVSRAVSPQEILQTGLAPNAALLMAAGDTGPAERRIIAWDHARAVALFHVKREG